MQIVNCRGVSILVYSSIILVYFNLDCSICIFQIIFNRWVCLILSSYGDPDPLWKQILIHISGGLDSILIFIKHFLSVLKISKIFVFFLRTSSEYLTRYGQGSVFKIRFQGSVVKTDPCLYFFEYSPDVLKKKTKVLDIFNTDKKCLMKINIESSPPEIWIRIRFHNGSGSPSLVLSG